MSLKTIAVIPVRGRLPLLKITIQRLYEKNGVGHIICVGDCEEERTLCNSMGAEFLKHNNKPLGKKWNFGFMKAREYNPDAVVYVGSSDWLSDNWIHVMGNFIEHDIVGKTDFNLLHYGRKLTMGLWPSYPNGSGRENEPIGIGRMLSRGFLEKVKWQPFDDYLNKAMDYSMIKKLMDVGGTVYLFNSPEVQSLSISCDRWVNMHSSDFDRGNVIKYHWPEYWLNLFFPEALKLEL